MAELPIDVVPGTDPPKFRWTQAVEHVIGRSVQEHEGLLPPSVECAVAALVALAKRQAQEIAGLQKMNAGLADRVAAQSELLGKRAEVSTQPAGAIPSRKRGG